MRRFRLSLATKYRLLFGSALLLIIAATLAVPWFVIQLLVESQSFVQAQRVADEYFRAVVGRHAAGGEPLVHADASLLEDEPAERRPRFTPLREVPALDDWMAETGAEGSSDADPREQFANQALRTFLARPRQDYLYQTLETGGQRQLVYAHAVRAAQSCLSCHSATGVAQPFRDQQLVGAVTLTVPAQRSDQELLYGFYMLGAGGLAGILAILVFYVITRRFILSPIDRLRAVTVRVAEGDLTVRADVETGDEFEQLSAHLNSMLDRLRQSQKQLKDANKLLDEKLGEMAELNYALYEANRIKGEFLANVTHELRTPLTSIIGFAELLVDDNVLRESPRTAKFAENILISGRILLEIINDLLDLAKIEAGKVELDFEPVRVGELCSTLLDFNRPLAAKQDVELTGDIAGALPIITTDRGRLRQILYNLLSNAIKFTPSGGRVKLAVAPSGTNRVRFSVTDTGPGISPEHQQVIFEKFRQLDASATRRQGGTGLGLAIAREMTDLLGGRIGVESQLGLGATFWVELPINPPTPSATIPGAPPPLTPDVQAGKQP